MKKVVRMLGLCALAALAFTSCKKNETNGTVTFTASIAQPTCDSRTHIAPVTDLGNYVVLWNENDVINVFNEGGTKQQYTAQNVANPTTILATFSGDAAFLADINVANKYTAFYPAVEMESDNVITMRINAEQMYGSTSFANNTYPMWARNAEDGNFLFTSDAGILNLRFRSTSEDFIPEGNYSATVDYIRLYSESDLLTGTLRYNLDGTLIEFVGDADSHEIIMRKENGQPIVCSDNGDTNFYIILPEGVLANGFTVEVYKTGATEPITFTAAPDDPTDEVEYNKIEKHKVTVMPFQPLPHD